MMPIQPVAPRLKARSERRGECLIWTGAFSANGYGTIMVRRENIGAHVAAYREFIGPVPDGLQVLHRCNEKLCIEPAHLYAGTRSQNTLDSRAAGTISTQKLTQGDVELIRAMLEDRRHTNRELAAAFGLHESTISNIKAGRLWPPETML